MIKPPPEKSPLAAFVATIATMGDNRALIAGMLIETNTRETLEDLEMLVNEKVVIGLRTPWVRRVAVPIVQANRHLTTAVSVGGHKLTPEEIARGAIEIANHCADETLRDRCIDWIKRTYHVA